MFLKQSKLETENFTSFFVNIFINYMYFTFEGGFLYICCVCVSYLPDISVIRVLNGPRQANLCLRAFHHDKFLTAHAQPFRGSRDLAFCLKVPLDSLLV